MRFHRLALILAVAAGAGCKPTASSTPTYTISAKTSPPASAVAGSAIPVAVSVLNDNAAAAGQTVTFTVTAGGGSVSSATVASGSDGSAATTWTLGNGAGVQTLHAALSGSSSVDFSVTATALPATALSITTQPSATVAVGAVLAQQPVVQVRDAANGAVAQSGVVVTASISSGIGTLGGTTTATTNSSGVATFSNLSLSTAGTVTLGFAASLNGHSANVVSSAVSVTAPNQLAITTAPNAGAQTAIAFFVQPVVQLKDGAGNPIHQAGVIVTASATGAATLAAASGTTAALTATTDANGQATFHDLALTGVGTATLQFTAPAFTAATSAAIVVSPQASAIISNGIPASVASASAASVPTYYSFVVPAGTTQLDFTTYGANANVELYARPGAYPTATDFSCHANIAGAAQVCSTTTVTPGTWFVAVAGPAAFSGAAVVAYAYTAACTPLPMTIGTPVNGVVTAASCNVEEFGASIENKYILTVTTPEIVAFNSTASGSNQILVYRQNSPRIGVQSSGTAASTYLLGPGTYIVAVLNLQGGSPAPSLTYSVATTVIANPPASCQYEGFAGGAGTFTLTLRNTDCGGTTSGTFSQRFNFFLGAGQTITATMASTAFDPLLKLETPITLTSTGTTVLTSNDNGGGGTTAKMTYTNPSVAGDLQNMMIEATSAAPGGLGAYTLTITVTPDYPDLRATAVRSSTGPVKQ